jgi:hypothetical protein
LNRFDRGKRCFRLNWPGVPRISGGPRILIQGGTAPQAKNFLTIQLHNFFHKATLFSPSILGNVGSPFPGST